MRVETYLYIEDIPQECIDDCSAAGDVTEAVAFWRAKLDFSVHRERAVRMLRNYGAWDADELSALSGEDIAGKVLWLACGDFHEYQAYRDRGYADDSIPSGSSIFSLV